MGYFRVSQYFLRPRNIGFPTPTSLHKLLNAINQPRWHLYSTSTGTVEDANVIVTVNNGVRKILLNRPAKKNAITQQMYSEIGTALQQSNEDENTKVVVITGTGDYFSSGNDISTFVTNLDNVTKKPQTSGSTRNEPFRSLVRGLIECRKPVVALVNGSAVGIGVTLLGLCDTSYASDKAIFSTPFSLLGISPECCSSYTFPRIMGYAKANEILAFNEKLTAKEVCDYGLISKVFPDDQLETEGWKLINAMTKLPLKSIMYSKELVRGELQRELLHKITENENNLYDSALVAEQVRKIYGHKLKK